MRTRGIDWGAGVAGVCGGAMILSVAALPWFGTVVEGESSLTVTGLEVFGAIDLVLTAAGGGAIGVFLLVIAGVNAERMSGFRQVVAAIAVLGIALIAYRIAVTPDGADLGQEGVQVVRRVGLLAGLAAAAGIAVNDVLGRRAREAPGVTASAPPADPLAAVAAARPPASIPAAAVVPPVEPAPAEAAPKRKRAAPVSAKQASSSATARAKPKRAPASKRAEAEDLPSLAAASVDELRAEGLSLTQARRVIHYRDERKALHSLDDLDAVPGLPRELIGMLKKRLVD